MRGGREFEPQVILGIEIEKPVSRASRMVQKASDVFHTISDNVPRVHRSSDPEQRLVVESPRKKRLEYARTYEREHPSQPQEKIVFERNSSIPQV